MWTSRTLRTFNLEEVVNFEDHIEDLLDIVDIKDLLNLAELVDFVDHMDLLAFADLARLTLDSGPL